MIIQTLINVASGSFSLYVAQQNIDLDNELRPQWEHYQRKVKKFTYTPIVLIPLSNAFSGSNPPYDNWEEIVKEKYDNVLASKIEIKINGESLDF